MSTPVQTDFAYTIREDGTLSITLTPPIPVGGQAFQFGVGKRLGGGLDLIQKSVASGYSMSSGVPMSGITVLNSGQGVFQIALNSIDTSGFDPGNYAFSFSRTTSGQYSTAVEGYMLLGY